jgi:hypothetical protein
MVLKRCYKCEKQKDLEMDFHKGATMCIDCRRGYDSARSQRLTVTKDTIQQLVGAIESLNEKVDYIIRRIDGLEMDASSDTESSSEEEVPKKKGVKKGKKKSKKDPSSSGENSSEEEVVPKKKEKSRRR